MSRDTFDLVVIGGGPGGLVAAFGAAGLGARVALVERGLLGGDCLNVGCVPSKALLRSARAVHEARTADTLGVKVDGVAVDFPRVMARMRDRRAALARHDSVDRLMAAGVDVVLGSAAFVDERTVAAGDRVLRFRRAFIATGSRPDVPPIAGLADAGYLTNENVFELSALPARLLIIGGGAIGCELAQAFAAFGSTVTIVDTAPRVLAREDPDASAIVRKRLEAGGVHLALEATVSTLAREGPVVRVAWRRAGGDEHATVDAVLVATGRKPNVEDLGLAAARVGAGKDGILVNDRLQTTNRRIFAGGDVASPYQFTHAADAAARLVLRNALFFGRGRASGLVIPWCTYTSPEVAHVGVTAEDVEKSDGRIETLTVPFDDVDRAVLDEARDGFLRVHHDRARIRGCTIVAPHAGELIGTIAQAMRSGGTLTELSSAIFPYPTCSEAFRKVGDLHQRSRLTAGVRQWLARYWRLRRIRDS